MECKWGFRVCSENEPCYLCLKSQRDAALLRVKEEHSDSLQHHHAWMCVEEMYKEATKKLGAADSKIGELREALKGLLEDMKGSPSGVCIQAAAKARLVLGEVAEKRVEKWPPLDNGTKVKTTQKKTSDGEWTEEALANRKWGVKGVIRHYHDSHGLCYDVRHEDGTEGCYEPTEFEVLS